MAIVQGPKWPFRCIAYTLQRLQGLSVIHRETSIDAGDEIAGVVCIKTAATEFCVPNVWYGRRLHHGLSMVGNEVEPNIVKAPYDVQY